MLNIFCILFDTAIRVGELVKIKLGDISKSGPNFSILIHGKVKKERRIFLSDKCSLHLQNYLDCYINDINDSNFHLFFFKDS